MELPSLIIYFDKRLIQTEQLKSINRGNIKLFKKNPENVLIAAEPWVSTISICEGL